MAWDYAELSKAAKAAGGPEKLVETIEAAAKAQGRSEMAPLIGLAALAATGITIGVTKLINHFKKKKAVSQEALDQAKAELIQGIKDYDAAHPETTNEEQCEPTEEAEEEKNE